MRILWLASWYPNQLFPLNGDFVQRHARAASLFNEIAVIHFCRDVKGVMTKNYLIENRKEGSLTEQVVYYHSFTTGITLLDRFFSSVKYRKLYKQVIREYMEVHGKPELVHVHVTMNAGLIALWIKRKFGIDYVVTEHWSGLVKEAKDGYRDKKAAFRLLWKKVVKQALSLNVVSAYLGESVSSGIIPVSYTIIPNVVDTNLFTPVLKKEESAITRFIHISRLDYQKNPEAIFKAFSMVKEKTTAFRLEVFSDESALLEKLIDRFNLREHVVHHKETLQSTLAQHLQNSDALILYSRYETFGCVVVEANACGIPVIVSDIPVMHELVMEEENGIFAGNDDAALLAEKISWFIEHKHDFNTAKIASATHQKYNYNRVGALFQQWYLENLYSSNNG